MTKLEEIIAQQQKGHEEKPRYPELIGHRSDEGKKVIQVDTGIPYDCAVDPYPTNRSYIESEINIEDETPALQVEEK